MLLVASSGNSTTAFEVESKLQTCIDDILSWLKCNKLVDNATKSNSMLIGSRRKITNLSLNVLIDKDVVEFTRA